MIRALETVYKGYRFRSRLEARWAVYFDSLGFAWEYEKQGFDLDDGMWYLPDFWLPKLRVWAEVKAQMPSQSEIEKSRRLVFGTKFDCIFLVGTPAHVSYPCIRYLDKVVVEGDCWKECSVELDDAIVDAQFNCRLYMSFVGWPGGGETGSPEMDKAVTASRSARF